MPSRASSRRSCQHVVHEISHDLPLATGEQVEPSALALIRSFGTSAWQTNLTAYLSARSRIRGEIERERALARIPVHLPNGESVTLSPGGQNPLIRSVIEEFCSRFASGAMVVYIGDAENKFLHLDAVYLENLGVVLPDLPSERRAIRGRRRGR